jgi:predicted porin
VTTGFRTPALSTYVDLANDDHALNYFSPRFSGFQVGVSYVPAATINGEGKNFPVQADENSELHDLISVGANFVESFGGFDVAVAGGYRVAQDDRGGNDDPEQYSAGLNLGFAGFTVGGSIGIEDSDRSTDGTAYDIGATYSTGPWAVGATYFHSEVEGALVVARTSSTPSKAASPMRLARASLPVPTCCGPSGMAKAVSMPMASVAFSA